MVIIDHVKRGHCFDLRIRHLSVCLSGYLYACLTVTDCHEIRNVLGTKVELRMCGDFLFPSCFKVAAVFRVFFAGTGVE